MAEDIRISARLAAEARKASSETRALIEEARLSHRLNREAAERSLEAIKQSLPLLRRASTHFPNK